MRTSEEKGYINQFTTDVARNYPKNVDIDPEELFAELEKDRDSGKLKDYFQSHNHSLSQQNESPNSTPSFDGPTLTVISFSKGAIFTDILIDIHYCLF